MPSLRAIPIPEEHHTTLRTLVESAAKADIDVICSLNRYKAYLKKGNMAEACIAWKKRLAASIIANTEHRILWDYLEGAMPYVSRFNCQIDYLNWVIEPLGTSDRILGTVNMKINFIERNTMQQPGSMPLRKEFVRAG